MNQGLQTIAGRASNTADAFAEIDSMAIDDRAVAFVAGDTTLGSPTNEADADFESTPARTNQTVRHTALFGTGVFNTFTIKRVSLHRGPASGVSGSSATLVAGVDTLSLLKESTFGIRFHFDLVYTTT